MPWSGVKQYKRHWNYQRTVSDWMQSGCAWCRFMAPEVLRSAVEPASDIWSAGVMAHQLLTGRFPFDDKRNPGKPSISKIWWASFWFILPI